MSMSLTVVLLLSGNYSSDHCKRTSVSTKCAETSRQLYDRTNRQLMWSISATRKASPSVSGHICRQ